MNHPAFIICLKRLRGQMCQQRLPILKEIFPHNLTGISPAVDAALLDIKTDSRVSAFAKYHTIKSVDVDYMHLSKKSAIGCSLTHIGLWQKSVDLNEPIFIIEDDVELDKKFITTAVQRIPNNVDHAALIYLPFVDRSLCSEYWCKVNPRQSFGGTQMYFITPKGARILLKQALPIVSEIDQYMGYVAATERNYSSVFYKEQYLTSYKVMSTQLYVPSTMHRNFSFRKILPENNMFYITIIIIYILMCYKISIQSTCRKKQKVKSSIV